MKSGLLVGLVAVACSMPAAAATQAAPPSATFTESSAPPFGSTPYVAFGLGEGGLATLDPNAPVTRVVVAPPPAQRAEDDEVEAADADTFETSAYLLLLAGLAMLLFITARLPHE